MTTRRHRPSLRVKTDQDVCRCGASLSDTVSDLTDFGKASAHQSCARTIILGYKHRAPAFGSVQIVCRPMLSRMVSL
jgi:hypothetical protein